MIVLSGADLVLPHEVRQAGAIFIEGDRIADVTGAEAAMSAKHVVDLRGHIIVSGFVDVHVHGIEGTDALDRGDAVADMARRLPRYGVTAFCPTTVACRPQQLRAVLQTVALLRRRSATGAASEGAPDAKVGARVLPAHLESNFINPDYCGAQPIACLRSPFGATGAGASFGASDDFDGRDILREIDAAGDSVGIVTLAPELDGALDLIRHLASRGRRVSLGHSGATLEQSRAAIHAGATQATHLFNRMPPLGHREPGLAGAVLTSQEIAAEVICDGIHVQRDMVRMAVAAKGSTRVMAITDAVAAAGLPDGSVASLGGRQIVSRDSAAYLEDGTLAGSVTTMDRVFRFLVREVGLTLPIAAQLCSTTPANEVGLAGVGAIVNDGIADLVVLDRELRVKQTYVAGQLVHSTL